MEFIAYLKLAQTRNFDADILVQNEISKDNLYWNIVDWLSAMNPKKHNVLKYILIFYYT